jgi:hypothetical protein
MSQPKPAATSDRCAHFGVTGSAKKGGQCAGLKHARFIPDLRNVVKTKIQPKAIAGPRKAATTVLLSISGSPILSHREDGLA